jgi:hypothetical protein
LAVAATCSALNATAATITSTWLGGAGAWEDPTQWSAGVPQNTASDSFTAAIDGQNPVASQVTLSTAVTIDSLQVDANDQLQISPTGALYTTGTSIQNNGLITVQAGGVLLCGLYPSQSCTGGSLPVTFSGTGTVQLQGGSMGGFLANQGNTVAGWGQIYQGGDTGFGIEDGVTINADVPGKGLSVHGMRALNSVLEATNGGLLSFDVLEMSGGTLVAEDGSSIATESDHSIGVTGATISALNHSRVALNGGGYSSDRFVNDSTSSFSFDVDSDHGSLGNSEFDGNFTVIANVSGTLVVRGTISGTLNPTGPTTIVNYGQVTTVDLYNDLGGFSGYQPTTTLVGGGDFTVTNTFFGTSPLDNVDNTVHATGHVTLIGNGGTVEALPGTLSLGGPGLVHSGLIKAPTGSLIEVNEGATGTGRWLADGGLIHITTDVETTGDVQVFHGGTLSVDGTMNTANLVVDSTGSLDVNGLLRVAGNLAFDGANGGRWSFGPSSVVALTRGSGTAVGDWAGWQRIEAAGRDLGPVAAGFTNDNFYLPDLVIGVDGRLALRDQFDNGNRSLGAPEAVYVNTLVFSDALGLLDLNGLHLYYNHLVGSAAQIIDVAVPEPEQVSLVASMLLAITIGAARLRLQRPNPEAVRS